LPDSVTNALQLTPALPKSTAKVISKVIAVRLIKISLAGMGIVAVKIKWRNGEFFYCQICKRSMQIDKVDKVASEGRVGRTKAILRVQ